MNNKQALLLNWMIPVTLAMSAFNANADSAPGAGKFDLTCKNAKTSARCVNEAITANNIEQLIFCQRDQKVATLDLEKFREWSPNGSSLSSDSEKQNWKRGFAEKVSGCLTATAANDSLHFDDIQFQSELVAFKQAQQERVGNSSEDDELSVLNRWSNNLLIGGFQMSGYDEEGNNTGFNETELFAQAEFNYADYWGDKSNTLFQADFRALFTGAGSVKEEEGDDSSNLQPGSFNDVNQYIEFSSRFLWSVHEADNNDAFFSIGPVVGMYNRETEALNRSSVDFFAGVALDYRVYDTNIAVNSNVHPRGRISITPVWYEEYAQKNDELRVLLEAQYRLGSQSGFSIGLRANIGEGVDEFGVVLGWDKSFDDLEKFIVGG